MAHRVFLDANVLFSAAYRSNAGLAELWKAGAALITSAYAVEEAYINLDTDEQRNRLNELVENVAIVESQPDFDLPAGIKLPDKDKPIILAAISAEATHLLTGDVTHFGEYYGKKIGGVLVMAPGDYLRTARRKKKR